MTAPAEHNPRQHGENHRSDMPLVMQRLLGFSLIATGCAVIPQLSLANEVWLLGPNSKTGAESTVVPTDCVEAADGSITCNTKIVNPPGDTPAKPYYSPFNN